MRYVIVGFGIVCAVALMLGAARGPRVQVIAHRGASWDAPEHTFASWDLALERGADWIEQDLHLTRDGRLVVVHDDTLERTARGPAADCTGPVAEKSLAQLQRCDMGSWFNTEHPERAHARFVGARIPTLDSVLTRYATRAKFYIETKWVDGAPPMEEALLGMLRAHRLAGPGADYARVLVQSFSVTSLERLHALDPALRLVLLIEDPIPPDSLDAVLARVARIAVGIGPARGLTSAHLVERAHAARLFVHPYTVNAPATMRYMLRINVDGMFTDRPDLLRGLLDP